MFHSSVFRFCILFVLLFSKPAPAAGAEAEPEWNARHEVYLTLEEALAQAFPQADEIKTETVTLSPASLERVARAVGHPLIEDSFLVYQGIQKGELGGYAMVGEEVGKFRPITSLVVIDPRGKVKDVMVLIYRESRGSDVKRKRFLQQFFGKGPGDPIQINQDILSISGATVSVNSMNAQVRKVLNVIQEAYFKKA